MTTSTDHRPPLAAPTRPLRPFHTPVRGHTFAHRPPGGAPLGRTALRLRHEPDNPADPHALAVWAEDGGAPWRVGYLERAVAARLATRGVGDPAALDVVFAGWWEEPEGRWHRPVVCLLDPSDERPRHRPQRLRRLPPAQVTRPA
jgi:hypothetical protein